MNEKEVLEDPSTSEWLRAALRTALACDPVTVANEAQLLVSLLYKRAVRMAQIEADSAREQGFPRDWLAGSSRRTNS